MKVRVAAPAREHAESIGRWRPLESAFEPAVLPDRATSSFILALLAGLTVLSACGRARPAPTPSDSNSPSEVASARPPDVSCQRGPIVFTPRSAEDQRRLLDAFAANGGSASSKLDPLGRHIGIGLVSERARRGDRETKTDDELEASARRFLESNAQF